MFDFKKNMWLIILIVAEKQIFIQKFIYYEKEMHFIKNFWNKTIYKKLQANIKHSM